MLSIKILTIVEYLAFGADLLPGKIRPTSNISFQRLIFMYLYHNLGGFKQSSNWGIEIFNFCLWIAGQQRRKLNQRFSSKWSVCETFTRWKNIQISWGFCWRYGGKMVLLWRWINWSSHGAFSYDLGDDIKISPLLSFCLDNYWFLNSIRVINLVLLINLLYWIIISQGVPSAFSSFCSS